jgi:predicted RNA polymerase sigma factor
MIDSQRSDLARRQRETETAIEAERAAAATPFSFESEQDDTLILLFMCCHSALTSPSAIALTLRAIGGLTTAEIAHAFMVPEATMAQRISRAKQSIKASGGSFHHPSEQEKTQRLRAVLHVLYLIFSEGYTSSVGTELQRPELAKEMIFGREVGEERIDVEQAP